MAQVLATIQAAGVLDPNSQSDNLATDAFDRVNLYLTAVASYQIFGLPGQFSPAFNWSNKPKIDLTAPFGSLTSPAQVAQAVGVLVGSGMTANLPINFQSDSWFAIANVSQYLFVKDDSKTVAEKLKSGQPINGVGIFARRRLMQAGLEASCRSGGARPYRSGRSPHWLKAKNPESPAARREALEDWSRSRRS